MLMLTEVGKMEKPEWIDDLGTYNTFPQPCVPSTERDFQAIFSCYSPEYIEFRQVYIAGEGYCNAHIFWFHNTGFMMVHPTSKFPTRYFRIGCKHVWEGLTEKQMRDLNIGPLGRCEHVQICNKCGTVYRTDSSD